MKRLFGRGRKSQESSASHHTPDASVDSSANTSANTLSNSYVAGHTPDTSIGEDGLQQAQNHGKKNVAFVSPHQSLLMPAPQEQSDTASIDLGRSGLCIPAVSNRSVSSPARLTPSQPILNPYKATTLSHNPLLPLSTASLAKNPTWSAPFPSSSEDHTLLSRSVSPYSAHTTSSSNNDSQHLRHFGTSHSLYPHSLDNRANSNGQLLAPVSWAEMTDAELVNNLGDRERTRQEVLWEIVASEDRYVQDLISLCEHYIEPLLHPHRYQPSTSPLPDSLPPTPTLPSANHSSTDLPIARKFARSLSETQADIASVRSHQPAPSHKFNSSRRSYVHADVTSTISLPAKYQPSAPNQQQGFLRHHLRSLGPPSAKKLHKSKAQVPLDVLQPPILPVRYCSM